ncbi:Ctf8-domain-containing protein [Suillus subaureus]|uniref:Ctf8-domain-containing protein n=1 Tax=Suillus subaureus TaxID=48587 RepID=A0A9P7JG56_9AGAM|nr:Ctf8-domain-containing protein [Suillus subaureus]KAG1821079.1 Ctf8-domain-containing protein [Suillus subaureus]
MLIDVSVSLSNAFNPRFPSCVAKLGHDELVLIELQGTLDIRCDEDTTRDGQFVGKLNLKDANKPTLTIGHHLLEGKVVTLPKPLGVMHRKESSKRHDYPGDGDSSRSIENTWNPGVSWDIVAVVTKKIVFSKRPMPIVNLGGSAQSGKV